MGYLNSCAFFMSLHLQVSIKLCRHDRQKYSGDKGIHSKSAKKDKENMQLSIDYPEDPFTGSK